MNSDSPHNKENRSPERLPNAGEMWISLQLRELLSDLDTELVKNGMEPGELNSVLDPIDMVTNFPNDTTPLYEFILWMDGLPPELREKTLDALNLKW